GAGLRNICHYRGGGGSRSWPWNRDRDVQEQRNHEHQRNRFDEVVGNDTVFMFGLIPLLAEEGWREAPGWSVRPKRRAGLTTPSAPSLRSAHPPLLCEEGNGLPNVSKTSSRHPD